MSFIPLKEGDWRALNIILENIVNSASSTIATTPVSSTTNPTIAKTVEIVGGGSSVTPDIVSEPTTPMPSMVGFTPIVINLPRSSSIEIDWSDWSGYGLEDVIDYDIYASTEATCTINDTNRIISHVKFSPCVISFLSPSITYSIRVQANGADTSQTASESASITVATDLAIYMDGNEPTVPGDIKVVKGTLLEIDDCDALTNWSIATALLGFNSGGTHEVVIGDTITGATSGATGIVHSIYLTSGSWAAGTAAGTIYLTGQSGTFQVAENINEGINSNVGTVTLYYTGTHSISLDNSTLSEGTGSIKITIDKTTAVTVCVKCTVSAKDLSTYNYLRYNYRANGSCATQNIYIGETKTDEQTTTATVSTTNTWLAKSWDISGITTTSRDQVTLFSMRMAVTGTSADYFWIDNIYGDPGPSSIKAYDGDRIIVLYPKTYSSSYTGTGATLTITIPRKGTPSRIQIDHMTSRSVLWVTGMATGHSKRMANDSADASLVIDDITTGITAVADCSFTVGTAAQVNTLNETYYYTVWWND